MLQCFDVDASATEVTSVVKVLV